MVELQLNIQEDEDINFDGGGGFDNDFDNNDDEEDGISAKTSQKSRASSKLDIYIKPSKIRKRKRNNPPPKKKSKKKKKNNPWTVPPRHRPFHLHLYYVRRNLDKRPTVLIGVRRYAEGYHPVIVNMSQYPSPTIRNIIPKGEEPRTPGGSVLRITSLQMTCQVPTIGILEE